MNIYNIHYFQTLTNKLQQREKYHQPPKQEPISYYSCFNPGTMPGKMEDQLAALSKIMGVTSPSTAMASTDNAKESVDEKEDEEKSRPKIWTHYRERYKTIELAPWNDKAFKPTGSIPVGSKAYGETSDAEKDNTQRPSTPEFPPTKRITMREKYSVFYNALTNGVDDLFQNHERLGPPTPQSPELVEDDNLENLKRYQEIAEHERQKYYNSFRNDKQWLEIPGQEKPKKNPNRQFRLTSTAYFNRQKTAQRIVWKAKYNRFYRNHKYRPPKLVLHDFTFPNPRREGDEPRQLTSSEYCWALRKSGVINNINMPNN